MNCCKHLFEICFIYLRLAYVAEDALNLLVLLSLPPQCWDYNWASPHSRVCNIWNRTQGSMHTRQALYQLSHELNNNGKYNMDSYKLVFQTIWSKAQVQCWVLFMYYVIEALKQSKKLGIIRHYHLYLSYGMIK